MQQRKRLLRANRRPLDSFDEAPLPSDSPCDILSYIKNQNLFLKLVGISLEMAKGAGVQESVIVGLEEKLLGMKGLESFSMLNQKQQKVVQLDKESKGKHAYFAARKYGSPEQQLAFLSRMEKEIVQVQSKEHAVYALKKYIQDKKKSIADSAGMKVCYSRTKSFLSKVQERVGRGKIQKKNFSGQSLREIIGRITPQKSRAYQTLKSMVHLKTVWGHTFFTQADQQYCPVYNALFDNSQKLIISGGDDGKIKVWGRQNGALISTLQGHKDYINKIIISKDNQLIFSAAQDGIRFFSLDTMSSYGGFDIRSIMDIGQIVDPISKESFVIFADKSKVYVLPKTTILSERDRKLELYDFKIYNFEDKVNSNVTNTNTMMINPEGIVFLGLTFGQILIFNFRDLSSAKIDQHNFSVVQGMSKIPEFQLPILCVLNAHEGDILQIKWNPILSYFSTGAKQDGVCKIWQFNPLTKPTVLKQLRIPKHKVKRKKKKYNCNFGCWNSTYTHMTCSYQENQFDEETESRGDGEVIVWNALTNQVTWEMSKTIDLSSIRAMDSHPYYSNIIAICDSYGKVMLTDIYENYIVNIFEERAFHLNHPSFCLAPSDCRFSMDGLSLLVATQYGNFSIYGYDIKEFYQQYPTEQILSSDYEDFIIDPKTFKPIINMETNIDMNLLNSGQIQNMRHQVYQNISKVNPIQYRKFIQNTNKIQHQNICRIKDHEVAKIYQCHSEFERNLEILKQNLDQIEIKRMTILFEEREVRQIKFMEVIQQKLQKIKEIDQNFSFNLINSTITSQNNHSNPYFSQIDPSQNSQENIANHVRRRGRRPRNNQYALQPQINQPQTRNRDRVMYNQDMSENQQVSSNHQQQQEQQFRIESEQSKEHENSEQIQSDLDDDDFDEENQSQQIHPHRSRRRNRNERNQHNLRSSNQRIVRRPVNQAIQDMENQYEEKFNGLNRLRKRNQIEEHSGEERNRQNKLHGDNRENRNEIRRMASRSLAQMRQQKQKCQLCLFRDSTVTCSSCEYKNYCDSCRSSRGKKIHQNTEYICYQCFYNNNISPQSHKNVTSQKYVLSSRTPFFIPQIGDEVVYFFQGYEEFLLDKIQILNNKYSNLNILFDIIPHQNLPDLLKVQKCTVTDISYAFPLEETSELTYQKKRGMRGRVTSRSNEQDIIALLTLKTENNTQFKVFFYPGYEYILRWEIYDDIIKEDRYGKFKLYDIVTIKDDEYQILEIKPLNSAFPSSLWKNIVVHKAQSKNLRRSNGEEEITVNIWNIQGFIDVTALSYSSKMDQNQASLYLEQIQKLKKFSDPPFWDIFGEFVDSQAYPDYQYRVEVGICLRLIQERLNNKYYACEQSFVKDVRMLYENSVLYNQKLHPVALMAEKMVNMILKGQNYNSSNFIEHGPEQQLEQVSTQKKSRLRQKPSTPQEELPRRQNEIKTSRFDDSEEQILPVKRSTRRVYQPDYEEFSQNQRSEESQICSGGIRKPNTRNRNKNMRNGNEINMTNSRTTRSRANRS